jgi:hypothetical protein
MLRESLRSTIAWAVEQVTDYSRELSHVYVKLGLA